MNKIYLLVLTICLLSISCKKDDIDPIIGKWQVTTRSPYSYEKDGYWYNDPNSQAIPIPLIDVAAGYYTWEFSSDLTYKSTNNTYITVVSSGTYATGDTKLTLTQQKYNDQSTPLLSTYDLKFTNNDQSLKMEEISRNGGNVIAVINLKRVK